MAVEYIPLAIGEEQNFSLSYNDTEYTFQLRYSDYSSSWYVNILDGENPIIMGAMLPVNVNLFKRRIYMRFGSLALIDTNPDSEVVITKQDLGDRIKLYRSI